MASKSKYLINIKTKREYEDICDLCDMFGDVVDLIKNKKIRKYFDDNVCKQKNVDDLWELFYHCINMSVDRDVEEYINSLEAIKND